MTCTNELNWYDSVHIIRQKFSGNWDNVIEKLNLILKEINSENKSRNNKAYPIQKYVEAENLINSSQKEDQLDNELIFLQGIIKANQKKYMEAKNLFKIYSIFE